jgi:hypothetical protein
VKRRLPPALLLAVAAALIAAASAYAAFAYTTLNSGNSFAAGTVALSDNDNGTAMLALSAAKPLDSDTSCIKVRFDGTLTSSVVLYGSTSGSIAQYLTLTVTRGTDSNPVFDSCATFDASGTGNGVIYSGPLSSFPTTYASGIADPGTWNTADFHIYKFVVTLADNANDQSLSGSASFTWEARNQ